MSDTRPFGWLEAFAAFCLGAPDDDCRLGDLSELHVRTEREIRARLDNVAGGARVVARMLAAALSRRHRRGDGVRARRRSGPAAL